MGIEWVAIGVVLIAGALFVGSFRSGCRLCVADRISRTRRRRYLVEQERRRAELDGAHTALGSTRRQVRGGRNRGGEL